MDSTMTEAKKVLVRFSPMVGSVVRHESGQVVGKVTKVEISRVLGRLRCVLSLDSGKEIDAVFTREQVSSQNILLDWTVQE